VDVSEARADADYGFAVEVPVGYDEAIIRTRLALRAEGFSILSEMHVGGIIVPEAGTERQYLIMGFWNTAVSEERIASDLRAAVHLPCNVVVQEQGEGSIVAALDPADTVDEGATPPGLTDQARQALERVLKHVEEQES